MDMDCLSNIYDPAVYDPRYYDLVAYYDNGLLSCDPDYLAHYLMRKGNRYMVYILSLIHISWRPGELAEPARADNGGFPGKSPSNPGKIRRYQSGGIHRCAR